MRAACASSQRTFPAFTQHRLITITLVPYKAQHNLTVSHKRIISIPFLFLGAARIFSFLPSLVFDGPLYFFLLRFAEGPLS